MRNIKRNSIKKLLPKKSRFFTLLEILVGLTLLLFATGLIGWKGHGFLKRRRFTTDIKRLEARCLTLHRLSMNMQVDWEGVFQKEGDHWTFQAHSSDPSQSDRMAPLTLHIGEVIFRDKPQKMFHLEFFSSGAIHPLGKLVFRNGKDLQDAWEVPEIFGWEEGEDIRKLGPIHPDDLGNNGA